MQRTPPPFSVHHTIVLDPSPHPFRFCLLRPFKPEIERYSGWVTESFIIHTSRGRVMKVASSATRRNGGVALAAAGTSGSASRRRQSAAAGAGRSLPLGVPTPAPLVLARAASENTKEDSIASVLDISEDGAISRSTRTSPTPRSPGAPGARGSVLRTHCAPHLPLFQSCIV